MKIQWNKVTWYSTLLTCIFFVAFILLVFLYLPKMNGNYSIVSIEEPSAVTTSELRNDSSPILLTYKNDREGIEFKYPSNWKLMEYNSSYDGVNFLTEIALDPQHVLFQEKLNTKPLGSPLGIITIHLNTSPHSINIHDYTTFPKVKIGVNNSIAASFHEETITSDLDSIRNSTYEHDSVSASRVDPAYNNTHNIYYFLGGTTSSYLGDFPVIQSDNEIDYTSPIMNKDLYLSQFKSFLTSLRVYPGSKDLYKGETHESHIVDIYTKDGKNYIDVTYAHIIYTGSDCITSGCEVKGDPTIHTFEIDSHALIFLRDLVNAYPDGKIVSVADLSMMCNKNGTERCNSKRIDITIRKGVVVKIDQGYLE